MRFFDGSRKDMMKYYGLSEQQIDSMSDDSRLALEYTDNIYKHFGITEEEFKASSGALIGSRDRCTSYYHLDEIAKTRGQKKALIMIYYDESFEKVVFRILPLSNQMELLWEEK